MCYTLTSLSACASLCLKCEWACVSKGEMNLWQVCHGFWKWHDLWATWLCFAGSHTWSSFSVGRGVCVHWWAACDGIFADIHLFGCVCPLRPLLAGRTKNLFEDMRHGTGFTRANTCFFMWWEHHTHSHREYNYHNIISMYILLNYGKLWRHLTWL